MAEHEDRLSKDATRDRSGEALERLFAEMRDTFGLTSRVLTAQTFIATAMRDGTSRHEMAQAVQEDYHTIGREMMGLARYGRDRKRGLRLIDERPDTIDPRCFTYTLTPKGTAALDRLISASSL